MRLWHIAALLVAGIAVGAAMPGRFTSIFGATLYLFLPALIFDGAWRLDLRVMRESWKAIALLSVPGVIVTAAIVAVCSHFLGNFGWTAALLLGTILSATDPVAVIAIFRRLNVPTRLQTIVESEALLNDAVAVVLYRSITAAALLSSGATGTWPVAWDAALGAAAGVVLGIVLAYAVAFVLRDQIGPIIQSIATLGGAYGGYIIADRLGWSGIFAVIAFGVALRELERTRLSVASAQEVGEFWNAVALIANLLLFFLIGTALDFARLAHAVLPVSVAIGAVLLSRIVVAYGLLQIVRAHVRRVWQTVVRMAGIRGALSLALALATPTLVAQKDLIIDATFAVVVVTILSGTLTLEKRLAPLELEK